MNSKNTGILFAAALVLSVGISFAGTTTAVAPSDAALAAQGWAYEHAPRSLPIGTVAEKTVAFATTNGASFYAVKMHGGGTVFMSGDSRSAPVLAFTSSDVDFTKLDPRSPLWAVLNASISREREARGRRLLASATSAQTLEAETRNAQKWQDLVERGMTRDYAYDPGYYPAMVRPGDVRVAPLVKTQWGQGNVGDEGSKTACYNYYTPSSADFANKVEGATTNALCGCVATAIAQVLRCLEYPDVHAIAAAARKERDCSWMNEDGSETTNTLAIVGKDVDSDQYEWWNMPDTLNEASSEEVRRAVGKLTYNAGVAVGMCYSPTNSGAWGCDVPNALRKTFNVGTAIRYKDADELLGGVFRSNPKFYLHSRSNVLQRTMFANFDAGLPVIVGLYGHEVVADGYGYEDGEPFVHFNMGWSGQGDVWYNVPNLSEAGYFGIEDITYNIFTNVHKVVLDPYGFATLSGRCLDNDGNPVMGAKISLYEAGTDTKIPGPPPTPASGVWGVSGVQARAYDIYAESADGKLIGCLLNVVVPEPKITTAKDSLGDDYDSVKLESASDPTSINYNDLGNSWGNEIVLIDPTYKIGMAAYETLDKAIAAVREGETIEILKAGFFETSVTVTNGFTIKLAEGVEATNGVVSVAAGVRLQVGAGARVLFEGVLFDCADGALVTVQAGGRLALSGVVALPTVVTSDEAGFELAGKIEPVGGTLFIDCPTAKFRDAPFGVFTCPYPQAAECKTNIVNVYDLELGGVAQNDTGKLIWDRVADPATALAKSVETEGGRETYYNSLTTLFVDCTNGATVTLLRDCPKERFQKPVAIRKELTITGAGVVPGADAGFTIEEGGKLTLQDVMFSNYVGRCLFKVAGGELVLAGGACLSNLSTHADCYDQAYGTTAVLGGKLTMKPGALIHGCRACHYNGKGGGIYIEDGELDMQGGEIVGCGAALAGGGIYFYNGTAPGTGAVVRLSGNVKVAYNWSGPSQAAVWDDIGLYATNNPVVVAGAGLTCPAESVGLRYEWAADNALSNDCACIEGELDEGALGATRKAFFCNADSGLQAAASADGKRLFWISRPVADDQCAPSEAKFVVIYDAFPDEPYYYADTDTAFANVQGDATVVVTNYVSDSEAAHHYYSAIEITHRIVLKGVDGVSNAAIRRHAACPIHISSEGELILTNVAITGSYSGGGVYPLIQVEGGKLELQNGADLRSASGDESRACGGVVVWDHGVFTMLPGSRIYNCGNTYWPYQESSRGVGGGLLVENATAYLRGGIINSCYNADEAENQGAGVCLANEAVAYISGPMSVWGNRGKPAYSNIRVEDSARLFLAGEIPEKGKTPIGAHEDIFIGVDPGERTDTNFVCRVSWEGATAEQLQKSAARFRKSNEMDVKGMVVTNGLGEALVVWSDELARSGKYVSRDGVIYGLYATQKLLVVQPKAFSLKQVRSEDGNMSLSLDGGVEGCWYTIYATESLSEPFKVESEIQLKAGETFQYPFDQTTSSKFYKVVAEEGYMER